MDRCLQDDQAPAVQQLQSRQRHHADQAEPPCRPQQQRQDRIPALPLHPGRRELPGVWLGQHQRQRK